MSEMKSNLELLNDALKTSASNAIKIHSEHSQPIVYRDDENKLIEEYSDGRIVVIKDYNDK